VLAVAPDLTPLSTQRLTDSVYALLRDRVLRGVHRPGERLHVDRLASALGVSQTPIKAALAALAVEGLIQVQPRRGTFVAPLSERDISESLSIRQALELLATDTVLQHAAPADRAVLRELAQRTAHATDVDEHFRANAAFHQHLIALSGNRKLAELYRQLNAHIQIARVHSRSSSWRERVPTEAAEHDVIVLAIDSRDLDGLRLAITNHLQRAQRSLLDQVHATACSSHRGVVPFTAVSRRDFVRRAACTSPFNLTTRESLCPTRFAVSSPFHLRRSTTPTTSTKRRCAAASISASRPARTASWRPSMPAKASP
jgi:DNA-binding GntR family transcriptional regulator